ncbi:MAG TPA: hypothetical protein VK250_06990 [Nitrososphaeraceae archaeon]|nr:hypothetical protein [Nitrososphaeraceae archaeon]
MIVALSLIIASSTVATSLTVLVNDSVQVIDTMVKKSLSISLVSAKWLPKKHVL